MKISPKKIILLLLVSYVLTACGTKGPLYIPERQYPQPASSGN